MLMKELTLRQVEVVRAVMIAGTIQGAADLLNVSAPRICRLIKHTESGLGIRLFERKAGIFVPATEAHAIFAMLEQVHLQMDNLNIAVSARFCRKLCVETQGVNDCLGFRRQSDRTAEMGEALV